MAQRLARLIAWLALALISCSEQHRAPVEDSQTHWLQSCESSNSCGSGMQCLCGRCVVTCQEQACSVAGRETQCMGPQTDALQWLCGAAKSDVAVCLERCHEDAACTDGEQCVEGACVPRAGTGCERAGIRYEPGEVVPDGDCSTCTCGGDGSFICTTVPCPAPEPEPVPPRTGCNIGGMHYEPGASVPSGDCNGCSCNADGTVQCTTRVCPDPAPVPPPAGCDLAGVHYEPGAPVPSGDCNACTCNADGSFQCTTIACPPAMSTGCDDNGKHYEIGEIIPRDGPICTGSCVCTSEGIGRCTGTCPT